MSWQLLATAGAFAVVAQDQQKDDDEQDAGAVVAATQKPSETHTCASFLY